MHPATEAWRRTTVRHRQLASEPRPAGSNGWHERRSTAQWPGPRQPRELRPRRRRLRGRRTPGRAGGRGLSGRAGRAEVFDAPNMLGMRTEALLTLGDHAGAAQTLDRAEAFAAGCPAAIPSTPCACASGACAASPCSTAVTGRCARDPGAHARAVRAPVAGDGAEAAALHNMLGIVGKFTGTFDGRRGPLRPRAAIYERLVAARTVIATLRHNLGGLAHSRGDLDTAERETRRALEMRTESMAPPIPTGPAIAASLEGFCRARPPRRGRARAAPHRARTSRPPSGPTISRSRSPAPRSPRPCTAGRLDEADAAYREGLRRASARRAPGIRCSPRRC